MQAEFIRTYIPKDIRIHLVGHSIGTYCILQLLQEQDIEARVLSCSLLFPTVHSLSSTPLGVFCWWIVRPILPLVILISWIIANLPDRLARLLFVTFFWIIGSRGEVAEGMIEPSREMIRPDVMRRVFHLGLSHIQEVRELNQDVVHRWEGRMKMYYGATDFWAPIGHALHIRRLCPTAHVDVCKQGYNHAFVTKYPNEIAAMVIRWITDWRKPKTKKQ